jgi:hypothetical protein
MIQQEIFDLATNYVRNHRLSHGLALPDAVIGATVIYFKFPCTLTTQKILSFCLIFN